MCSRFGRILQGHAEQGQDRFSRHVQEDVRDDVRAELVLIPGPVSRPREVLRRGQHEHHRSAGKLFLCPVSKNVHRHEQPICIRCQVSNVHCVSVGVLSGHTGVCVYTPFITFVYNQGRF